MSRIRRTAFNGTRILLRPGANGFRFAVHRSAGRIVGGMTDATPEPKRKRWRCIIAGVLLFVVSVAGWWYWPRGDARFVGRWSATYSNSGLRPSYSVWELSRNGSGRELVSRAKKSIWFSWSVRDEVLKIGYDPPGFAKQWVESFAQRVFNWTWHTLAPIEATYQILSANPDEIQLRFEDESVTLSRIPE